MKNLHALINDVDAHNQQLAANLYKSQPHLFPIKPAIAKGDASFNTTFNKSKFPIDYQGVVGAKQDDADKLWQRTLKLDNKNTMTAVLSVIDKRPDTNETVALPVVFCVGVNYGQQGGLKNYCEGQKLCDDTGMQMKLQSALNLAGVQLRMEKSHLVAANFCPWITQDSWQNVAPNCLVSALLLRSFGYDDPSSEMASLIDLLQPSCIVFHGVGNSVPILALETLRKCKGKERKAPETLFCDNLGYPVWRNSVALL